ncbi:hypothetical protein AD937_13940 [Gluconobacter japonicus]|nr:hypothetical protein AD937_13940 [Gluconobacter japonicus]
MEEWGDIKLHQIVNLKKLHKFYVNKSKHQCGSLFKYRFGKKLKTAYKFSFFAKFVFLDVWISGRIKKGMCSVSFQQQE